MQEPYIKKYKIDLTGKGWVTIIIYVFPLPFIIRKHFLEQWYDEAMTIVSHESNFLPRLPIFFFSIVNIKFFHVGQKLFVCKKINVKSA